MKLKEHIAHVAALVKENPKALEMDVVTSSDDEGNSFRAVHYAPGFMNNDDTGVKQVYLN